MSGDEPPEQDAPLRFEDPRAIRALAHPARMAIIDALASGDELTATDCAALTGLSPSATAYHLKLLQRFGFAQPAPPPPSFHSDSRASGRAAPIANGAVQNYDYAPIPGTYWMHSHHGMQEQNLMTAPEQVQVQQARAAAATSRSS